jgi:hypothetical protein
VASGRSSPIGAAMLLLALADCAAQQAAAQRGIERVHGMWLTDNERVYATQGSRTVALDRNRALAAVERALKRIGLEQTLADASTAVIVADRALTSADISGAIREAELPRVQRIMSEEMGPVGSYVPMGFGEGVLLVATATVKGATKGSTVAIRMCNGLRSQTGEYQVGSCVIPTAQLRAGLNEFWRAFDDETSRLKAERPATAGSAGRAERPPRAASVRPPSQWILPD